MKQLRFIILHAVVMGNVQCRNVSINEAGIDWSHNLAKRFRETVWVI